MNDFENRGNIAGLMIPEEKIVKLREIVSERVKILNLISRAQENRDRVKDNIFRKVMSDYEAKMAAVAEKYEPVRRELAAALRNVREEENRLKKEMASVHEEIEEIGFRCEIGEFGERELKSIEEKRKGRIGELEGRIRKVEETYEACRRLMGDDDFNEAMESAPGQTPAREPARAFSPPPPRARAFEPEPPSAEEFISIEPPSVSAAGSMEEIELVPSPVPLPELSFEPEDVVISPPEDIIIEAPEAPHPLPSNPLEFGNPEMTFAEPIPFVIEEASGSSTLDGGPSSSSGGDVEATISFQQRSVLLLHKTDGSSDTFLLGMEPLSIGRNHKNDVVLLDRSISRKHAEVKKEPEGYVILDMSSGGGISVNGEKKKRAVLRNGDEIQIGDFRLAFKEELGY